MSKLKKVVYSILGFSFLLIGFTYLLYSVTGLTGFVIIDTPSKPVSSLVSIIFTLGGFGFLSAARKRKTKGQAAMEFLLTYGWAIMAALSALGVLAYFGVFNSASLSPPLAVVSSPLYITAWSISPASIALELSNNDEYALEIQSVDITNCGTFSTPTQITTHTPIIVTIQCGTLLNEGDQFRGDITVNYNRIGSTIAQISTGSISGTVSADGGEAGGQSGEEGCSDELLNNDETDVDCGGPDCDPCADGLMCNLASDCQSSTCESGTCVSCSDNEQNQDESDVDCGGSCASCPNGDSCLVYSDCQSGYCNAILICTNPPTTVVLDHTNILEDGHIIDASSRDNTGLIMEQGFNGYQTYRSYLQFDTTSIPDSSTISDVKLSLTVDSNGFNCDINQITSSPSSSSDAALYSDIADGTSYLFDDTICAQLSQQTVDLGTNADSDLQSLLSADWFAVGIKWNSEATYGDTSKIYTSENSPFTPTLTVTYT